MSRRKKTLLNSPVECLDCDDESVEDADFIEGDVDFSKYAVATFSFANDSAAHNVPGAQKHNPETAGAVTEIERTLSSATKPEAKQKIKEISTDEFN